MSAIELLERAAGHLKDRAVTYDKTEGERSIGATVEAFNAITGDGKMNSEERGWLFMAILKMVRSQQGNYRADNYEDLATYGALMGEAACEERNGGCTDREIEAAAFPADYDESRIDAIGQNGNDGAVYHEYTLDEVVGNAVLSEWARWVAIDSDGQVWEYSKKPIIANKMWNNSENGRYMYIRKVARPHNFTSCIWEVNK